MHKIEVRIQAILSAGLVALPASLAGFSLVTIVLLLVGHLQSFLVFPAGLYVAGIIVYLIWNQQKNKMYFKPSRETVLVLLSGLIFVMLWVGFNLRYNSEHVFINRDPGIYTVTGKYLENHADLTIHKSTVLSERDGYYSTAAGFDTDVFNPNLIFVQGAHLLPSLLGLSARLFGDAAIFNGNVVLGGAALLSLFAFGLSIMKARFAFLAMICLGLLLPFIYFVRDSYSEILALIFTFGSLTLLRYAIQKNNTTLWFLAGLVLGAGALTRIDAYLSIAAIIAFVTIYLALLKSYRDRRRAVIRVGWFFVSTAVTATVGFLDVRNLASGYFVSSWPQIRLELFLILFMAAICVFCVVYSWRLKSLKKLDKLTKKRRASMSVLLVLVFWLVMASRPLWMSDPEHRSEMTVLFLGAYLGPIMLALGVSGLALMAHKAMNSRSDFNQFAPFFMVIMTTAMLYVIHPSISSDQIWASRRMLPVVLPGLILAGLYMAQKLYDYVESKYKNSSGVWQKPVLVATIIVAVFSPLAVTRHFLTLAPFQQSAALVSLCENLPHKSTIIWLGSAGMDATIATRAFCGVEAVRYISTEKPISNKSLAGAYEKVHASGNDLFVGVYDSKDKVLLPAGSNTTFVADRVTQNIELTRRRIPTQIVTGKVGILVGIVDKGGQVRDIDE